jgi:hypothetical protein
MQVMGFPIRALIAMAIGASVTLLANMLSLIRVGQINQVLPENERMSYFWYDLRIRKRHRQLYPKSKLVIFLDICIFSMIVSFVLFIVLMRLK